MERKKEMISVIIVACSDWGDYATPYIDSILKYKPDADIVLVDNRSKNPYLSNPKYNLITTNYSGEYQYTKLLNMGAESAKGDWLIFSNDDVLCIDDFSFFEDYDKNAIYGAELRSKTAQNFGVDVDYLYGWNLVMHRDVFNDLGGFNVKFMHAGLDDIDICYRAKKKGYELVEVIPYPFVHLGDEMKKHRRALVKNYAKMQSRSKNIFLREVSDGGID